MAATVGLTTPYFSPPNGVDVARCDRVSVGDAAEVLSSLEGAYLHNLLDREFGDITATDVLSTRDRFEMVWVYTRPVPTEVVEFEPLRNRPDVSLVVHPVGHLAAAIVPAEKPMPTTTLRTLPYPASGSRVNDMSFQRKPRRLVVREERLRSALYPSLRIAAPLSNFSRFSATAKAEASAVVAGFIQWFCCSHENSITHGGVSSQPQ